MAGLAIDPQSRIAFGPFTLRVGERLLERDGSPVDVGGRTLDVLITLVSRHNEVVSKRELMVAVWPDVTVEETSLRFHVANLRKVLGDGRAGARYIATLAGRGYCFVAPVTRETSSADESAAPGSLSRGTPPPRRSTRIVGREDDIVAVGEALLTCRFVTVIGPGGVGKTTVAAAVADALVERFAGACLFVDLGALMEPALVAPTIAAVAGLSAPSQDAAAGLVAHLSGKRALIVLDTCEHVLATVAPIAARLVAEAGEVHILATSREALRVEGEHVHRLDTLAYPPGQPQSGTGDIRDWPAAELFLERMGAAGVHGELSGADAALVAGICGRLDGIPLAIEMAASRVATHGLAQVAALLDRQFSLVFPGRRTAPQRQRTLAAMLDWSYALLEPCERKVLARLAVFVGDFGLDGALRVAAASSADNAALFSVLDALVEKSMVATRPLGASMRYRLLDTTRAYIAALPVEAEEAAATAARHSAYYRDALQEGAAWGHGQGTRARACNISVIGNARAALLWCFGDEGDQRLGTELAAAAMPYFLALSLLGEVRRWATTALGCLDGDLRGTRVEMHLQGTLGASLTFARGEASAAHTALERAHDIAQDAGTPADRVRLLGPLVMLSFRTGAFDAALHYGAEGIVAAQAENDPAAAATAHSLFGIALHYKGDLARARAELTGRLHQTGATLPASYLGFEQAVSAGFLARTLWLLGEFDAAVREARQAVLDAEPSSNPLTRTMSLMWAATVALWQGDLDVAESYVGRLDAFAGAHGLLAHQAVARGLSGQLTFQRGDADGAVARLSSVLGELQGAAYELQTTPLSIALVHALTAKGRVGEGLELADRTISLVVERGDLVYLAEALRAKARVLAADPSGQDAADQHLVQALDLAARQRAHAWELRVALDLATLRNGRPDAMLRLKAIVDALGADAHSSDLVQARRLLMRSSLAVQPTERHLR